MFKCHADIINYLFTYLTWEVFYNIASLHSFLFNPFVSNAPLSTPWKHQKTLWFFGYFQGVEKRCIGNEWVKEIVYLRLFIYLSLHWLIMRVGFEIKNLKLKSKLKSSVNRLNLFKVLIVSSTSFLQGCANCLSDSSSSFSSSPSVITSAGCLENSETIYSTDNGRNWLVPSRKCTSRNVELIGSFFVRPIFVKRFQCFILCFLGHFVMLSFCGHSEHNTQAIFFYALIFKIIKFKNSGKT